MNLSNWTGNTSDSTSFEEFYSPRQSLGLSRASGGAGLATTRLQIHNTQPITAGRTLVSMGANSYGLDLPVNLKDFLKYDGYKDIPYSFVCFEQGLKKIPG